MKPLFRCLADRADVQRTLSTSTSTRTLGLGLAMIAACSSSPSGVPTVTPGSVDAGTPGSDAGSTADAGSSQGGNDSGAKTDSGSVVNTGTTALTGTLGTLGAVQPTVSSLWISNSGESLLYLSSAPITCEQLKTSRWLGSVAKGAQVVELVLKGDPTTGTLKVPPAEVNYAGGGKSSSYEVGATSGSITFTKAEPKGVVEGTLNAAYDGADTLSGAFHAVFCDGGQGY